jgi:DNA mismatch endonuclease (patch repair protein)
MQGNRRRDTTPEVRLRRALHKRGWRFRVDLRIPAAGRRPRPDIAFTRHKVAVFIDGCFWHGCPEHGSAPKTNRSYWGPKLRRNLERDLMDELALAATGWTVVRLWEHVDLEDALARVEDALQLAIGRDLACA